MATRQFPGPRRLKQHQRYANNFANVGSQTRDKHGKYLLSYNPPNLQYGVQKGAADGDYLGIINSPTPYGIFLCRTNALNEDDLPRVHRFQDEMKLSPVGRKEGSLAPTLDRNVFLKVAQSASGPVSEAEQVLHLTAALAHLNPPEVIQDRAWIASTLQKAGIKDGKFTQPAGTSLDQAVAAANESIQAIRLTAGFMKNLGNDWRMSSSLISGNFHSFYAARHLVAVRGYLQPTADQSIYPSWYPGRQLPDVGGTEYKIGPNQALLFRFASKPKLLHSGFWSLTVYGGDQLLVANSLNRYSLGDRSNLRYPDGTPLKDREDGAFEILVQPDDVAPPERLMSNWLPGPAGGGDMSFTLRAFAPASEMIDSTYLYPEVQLIDAIVA